MVALLFGVWFSLDKILLGYLHPFALAALTYLIASVFLFFVYISPLKNRILNTINKKSRVENSISKKEYLILFLTAIFGSVIAPALYLSGLSRITAVNAALLTNVEILFIIVIGIFFLKEKVHKKDILGFALLLIGAIFLSTNGLRDLSFNQSLFGSLLVISASFFWSLDTSLSKFLSHKRDIIFITALKSGIGGSILLVLSLILGLNFTLPLFRLPLLLFIGIVAVSFSLVLIYYSLRTIGSTRTGSIFALSSLFGAITAYFALGEPLTVLRILFGILMLMGVLILYKEEK
ncbi:transporter [Methanobacterium bryantii]|jgi:drug/metabolite transporter (DMT)-like permease|uniref:Transporter n=2 Tax=Methanobacteriaceae TaxID=2159 RepID=A0A2A2HA91_METBR|nr:transporter [Methanobacterium bryantii]